MATTSRSRSAGASGPPLRSLSPSGRFYAPATDSSSFASSTSSSFASPTSSFFNRRSTSPTRVNLYRTSSSSLSSSVRFSIDNRSTSPGRSLSVSPRHPVIKSRQSCSVKKTCMCSPTNHPGSFRCSLHKNASTGGSQSNRSSSSSSSFSPSQLNMRRSAMTNSLVRIGGVEGELMKRTLAALIRPSSHQQRRRDDFEPRPSRLSVMLKAED